MTPEDLRAAVAAGARRGMSEPVNEGALKGLRVIELGQLVFLPERYASLVDILTNSVGALIGVGITMLLRRRTRDTTSR